MRRTMLALSAIAAIAAATTADAQTVRRAHNTAVPVVAGAAAGTAVGVGLYNGWYGGSFAASLPSSAAGAAATGAIAGIGTAALIHAATTPCQGFHAALGGFLTSPAGCVNGTFVGAEPAPVRTRRVTRVIR